MGITGNILIVSDSSFRLIFQSPVLTVTQNWLQMVHLTCFGMINGTLFVATTFGMTIMVSMLSVENLDSPLVPGKSQTLTTAKMLSKLAHAGLARTSDLALGNKTSTG